MKRSQKTRVINRVGIKWIPVDRPKTNVNQSKWGKLSTSNSPKTAHFLLSFQEYTVLGEKGRDVLHLPMSLALLSYAHWAMRSFFKSRALTFPRLARPLYEWM